MSEQAFNPIKEPFEETVSSAEEENSLNTLDGVLDAMRESVQNKNEINDLPGIVEAFKRNREITDAFTQIDTIPEERKGEVLAVAIKFIESLTGSEAEAAKILQKIMEKN